MPMGSPAPPSSPVLASEDSQSPEKSPDSITMIPAAKKMIKRRAAGGGRAQIRPAPSSGPASIPSSSVIPLPKSHIHRTPSELQLADDMRRAQYDDVRMYARLVVGMQSQIQRDYHANGGTVHPLSKKSLAGVVKTKQAKDEDLEKLEAENQQDDEVGWEMTHIQERHDEDSVDSSPWSTRPPPKSDSDGSLSTRGSMEDQHLDEDFVFSLEL